MLFVAYATRWAVYATQVQPDEGRTQTPEEGRRCDMEDVELEALRSKAQAVAKQHAEQVMAFNSEEAAESELLSKVIESVKPSLGALSSRIREAYTSTAVDAEVNGGPTHPEVRFHSKRGLNVGVSTKSESKGSGTKSWSGVELWLMQDGTFWLCDAVEYQTQWVGSCDRESRTNWREVSPLDVAKRWDVEVIIGSLGDKLTEQLEGNAKNRTAKSTERAKKLAALTELLGQ